MLAAPLGEGIRQDRVSNAVKIILAPQETGFEEFTQKVGQISVVDPSSAPRERRTVEAYYSFYMGTPKI